MTYNEELLQFLKNSPTAYHAVDSVRNTLLNAGYVELKENSRWDITPGGKYFTTRNGSSILAFRYPGNDFHGFMIAASHSDSPTYKIKVNPEIKSNGYVKLNVEMYGGALSATWLDRPLSIAGRVSVIEDGKLVTKLVKVDRDLVMIPSLAIHMDRTANTNASYNVQNDMLPIFSASDDSDVLDVVAKSCDVKKSDILGHDLFLYNRQEGTIWGAQNEYISAGHLDDLQCGYANMKGFLESENGDSVPVLVIFDNEEVGSLTYQGADSTFLQDSLDRILSISNKSEEERQIALRNSFMISADNAHAIHPNHLDKADPVNRPQMNQGVVVKFHGSQKYTSDAISAGYLNMLAKEADVPLQQFTNRSDMVGGSTLGNLSNRHVSIHTVDVGLPQLAMHSAYETAGVKDTEYLIDLMRIFFKESFTCEE